MRVRAFVCAAAMAAAAGVLPASASAPQPDASPPDHALHAFQRSLAGADVNEVLAARRAMMTASRADGGLGFRTLTPQEAGARPGSFPSSWGFPAADLNGDALDDVFILHHGPTLEMLLTARRGIDGRILWSQPLAWSEQGGYWGAVAFMDVAGDAAEEVVIYHERLDGPGSQGFAWMVRAQSLHQRIDVLDARTGDPLYVREETASIQQVFLPPLWVLKFDRLIVNVEPAGDAGGGSGSELLVGTLDHHSVLPARVNGVPEPVMQETLTAELVDVSSGETVAAIRETEDGYVSIVPAGDLDGDGRVELLVLVGSAGFDRGRVRARSVDGAELWSHELDAPAYASWPKHALSLVDARTNDVVVVTLGNYVHRVIAFRGEDGAELWTVEGVLSFRDVGDIDGDGGLELMVNGTIGRRPTERPSVAVQVVRGSTLMPLWQRPHDPDVYVFEFGCLICTQDVTGDGILDPILGGLVGGQDPPLRYHVALDGVDGGELWRVSSTSSFAVTDPLGADVNGNGTGDVVIAREARTGRTWSLSLQVADGSDLSLAWDVTLPAPGRPLWASAFAANLTGDGAREIVVTVAAETGDRQIERVLAIGPGGMMWYA